MWRPPVPLIDAALAHYCQAHRAYHDAHHVEELLGLAEAHAPDLSEAEGLAILFHDAVYVPGAPHGVNEDLSARIMDATVAALVRAGRIESPSREVLDVAAAIVRATTHAEPPPAFAARVCDLDLWRLAAPWEDFQRHALGIRHEYLFLRGDDASFWAGRHAFYRAMLEKPALFSTRYFRERFEPAARDNMRRALAA